jgi:hypothetical protein
MSIYLNMRTKQGVETIDEFNRDANQSPKEFRQYVQKMITEYHLAGMNVYRSIRCTKEWKRKN